MTETFDAVILGAGIVGAACADALSREGLLVAIVDASVAGGGATAAGMGHIVVMDDSEPQFALTKYSRDLWNGLRHELPETVEFDPAGTLWVAADDEEMTAVRAKRMFYLDRDVRTEVLDSRALQVAEPQLRPGLAGALLVPDDSVIYAPCAAQWLLERAQGRGAVVCLGERATAADSGGVRLANGSHIAAGVTVCATGASAVDLFPSLALRPRKGHLAITDRYPGFVRHQLVELGYLKSAHGHAGESVAFNVQPRATGQVLIGSSRQYGQTHSEVDAALLRRMLQRAVDYLPGLSKLSILRTWTGFRAATEDKLPLIGPCPGHDRVLLATGHEGLGITTALATAELITALVVGRSPVIPAEPYLPARMLERAHV